MNEAAGIRIHRFDGVFTLPSESFENGGPIANCASQTAQLILFALDQD
jgi:hypothetical protein